MMRVLCKFLIQHTEYRVVKEVDSTLGQVFMPNPPVRYYVTICFPKAAPPKNRPVNMWGYFDTVEEALQHILASLTDPPKRRTKKRGRT